MMRSFEARRPALMSNLGPLVDCDDVTEDAFASQLRATPTVTVKNTFIQSVVREADDSDVEELPPMVVTRSCPASHCHREGPWERKVFCKAPLAECIEEACGSGDDFDPELPMMVVRTCSDFSTLSGGQAFSLDGSFEDPIDYGFASSPTHAGREAFPGERGDGADSTSGIGSTFLNRIHGVSVKNTFIDDYLDEEDEALASVVATHSCPPPVVSLPSVEEFMPGPPGLDGLRHALPFEDFAAFHFQAAAQRWAPSQAPQVKVQQPLKPPGIFIQRGEGAQTRVPSPDLSRKMSSDSDAASGTSLEPLAAGVAPLESRQPEMSAGSASHECGECKPCAWFWRPQGCLNGKDCRHCHLCPQGAMKTRRKTKKAQTCEPASGAA
jgi:hypothetical protein